MDEVAAAVHSSSQEDHKNSAASVLILASPPFPLVFAPLCVGLAEGSRIRRAGPLSWGALAVDRSSLPYLCTRRYAPSQSRRELQHQHLISDRRRGASGEAREDVECGR